MSFGQRPVLIIPEFGRIEYFGSYWKGAVQLGVFGKRFDLIVRAGRDGPSAAQVAAMSQLVSDAVPMLAIHRDAPGFPGDGSAAGELIWDLLQPEQIGVLDVSYYGDGRIAILITFGSSLHPDFAPAIETADGHFVQVLSGT